MQTVGQFALFVHMNHMLAQKVVLDAMQSSLSSYQKLWNV